VYEKLNQIVLAFHSLPHVYGMCPAHEWRRFQPMGGWGVSDPPYIECAKQPVPALGPAILIRAVAALCCFHCCNEIPPFYFPSDQDHRPPPRTSNDYETTTSSLKERQRPSADGFALIPETGTSTRSWWRAGQLWRLSPAFGGRIQHDGWALSPGARDRRMSCTSARAAAVVLPEMSCLASGTRGAGAEFSSHHSGGVNFGFCYGSRGSLHSEPSNRPWAGAADCSIIAPKTTSVPKAVWPTDGFSGSFRDSTCPTSHTVQILGTCSVMFAAAWNERLLVPPRAEPG